MSDAVKSIEVVLPYCYSTEEWLEENQIFYEAWNKNREPNGKYATGAYEGFFSFYSNPKQLPNKPSVLIVEAPDWKVAEERAQKYFGVYLNGVERGIDCACCGDAWEKGEEFSIPFMKAMTFDEDHGRKEGRFNLLQLLDGGEAVIWCRRSLYDGENNPIMAVILKDGTLFHINMEADFNQHLYGKYVGRIYKLTANEVMKEVRDDEAS